MSPHEEFESLLSGLLDGPADAQRNERLCELLRLFPALQNDYLDLVQLHALLIWREGRAVLTPSPTIDTSIPVESGDYGFGQSQQKTPTQRPRRWHSNWVRAAAMFCLGAGMCVVLILLFTPSTQHENGPEIVEQLVSWNLEISQAQTPAERQMIHDTQAVSMRGLMNNSQLSDEDRELAQTLVDTGSWLTNNSDPMAEAERFGEIADKLLLRLDSATAANDSHQMTKIADTYRRLTEVGVSVNLERAMATPSIDPKHKHKLDHLIAGDDGRAKKLEELLEHHPDPSWKAIHRALKGHHRKLNTGQKLGN
jgi:hypothetical protein